MDVPTERDIADHERLSALYDASDGGQRKATASDLDDYFQDMDERIPWLREMADRGLVSMDGMLVPRVKVSAAGARFVEQSRARRNDRGLRRTTCRRRLLAWTDHQPHGRLSNALSFPTSNHGWFEGDWFDWEETTAAAAHLTDAGLLRSSPTQSQGTSRRVDVAITDEGRECIENYDGDPAAYLAAQRQTTPTVTVEGSGNALSFALGDRSTASATATTINAKARLLADALTEALPGLSLDDEGEADEHLADLRSDDDGKRGKALRWVGRLANDTSTSATGQVLGEVAMNLLGG